MKKLIAALLLISLCAGGAVFTAYGENGKNQAPAAKETAGFEIERLVVATGVDNRVPVGIAETFPHFFELGLLGKKRRVQRNGGTDVQSYLVRVDGD